jgi:hypothetical protein
MARLTGLEPATPGVTGRYSNQLSYNRAYVPFGGRSGDPGWVARLTGLEPATPGVTGRYSNQLSYNRMSTHPDRRPSVDCVIGIAQLPVKRCRTLFPSPERPFPKAFRTATGRPARDARSATD